MKKQSQHAETERTGSRGTMALDYPWVEQKWQPLRLHELSQIFQHVPLMLKCVCDGDLVFTARHLGYQDLRK